MRIKLKDGTVIEQEGVVEIDTAMGTLFADPMDTDTGYPGFYIVLQRPDGNDYSSVKVEIHNDPVLKVHYWSPEADRHMSDPSWSEVIFPEEIDSAFKEEA